MIKGNLKVISASFCFALLAGFVNAKPKAPELVKEEEGYYYGYGKADSKEEAELAGKRDLIENALTSSLRAKNSRASRVNVNPDAINNRCSNIKPYVQDKPGTNVTYRIKIADWEKEEKKYTDSLRSYLTSRYEGISKKGKIADKINASVEILNELASNGETELLTFQEDGTELFSRKVEAVCSDIVKNLSINISVKDGFISSKTKFSVKVVDENSKPVSNLKLKTLWEVSKIISTDEELAEVVASVNTNSNGEAVIDYPTSDDFKNQDVTLTVSTAFAMTEQASKAMKKFDTESAVEGKFTYIEDFKEIYKTVNVPAGEFKAGAVSQDNKAGKREASRKVKTGAYAIKVTPVTNKEYASYLHITRNETLPEYFENNKYNQLDQPVIGITYEAAEAYANWLSEQTGEKYRLPTEEEWEKAARAGKDSIYPWGDESPKKAKAANFKGNGKFKTTSPVGSFEKGTNEWGLVDMSGNVWEWTSSTHSKDNSTHTVKGGSWMDGELELRISNYKDMPSDNASADVGFRLVKEISK